MRNLKEWKGDTIKFLVIGDSGTGKTKFAGTFPKPYVFSFDNGIDTLAGKDIDYDIYIDTDRKQPTSYQRFKSDWDRISKDAKYETLVIDSITQLSKCALDDLIYVNQLVDKNLGDKCWDIFRILKNRLYDVIANTQYISKYVVCTALPEWELDKNSGEMRVLPSTEGKFRQDMPSWFGEVYYTVVERVGGNLKYKIRTKSDGKYIAKSRIDEASKTAGRAGVPEFFENPTYDMIMKYIRGEVK